MTEVAFHFGAPDKLAYVCRLLRKAAGSGASIVLVADSETLQFLDSALWAVSSTDFVPHCLLGADLDIQRKSRVVLAPSVDGVALVRDVLVNLGQLIPTGFDSFKRVIEVVSTQESDRQLARDRWKQYAKGGFTIVRHDLQLKGAT